MSKFNLKWVAGLFLLLTAISGVVHGLQDPPIPGIPSRSGGEGCYSTCGGEIPWPFQVSNQAVELSDGERYLLLGKVVIRDHRAFFEVDLLKHNWLSTVKRRENPRYPLEGSVQYWSAYEGKRIRLVSTARWSVIQETATHEFRVEVVLSSLADPAVTAELPVSPSAHELR